MELEQKLATGSCITIQYYQLEQMSNRKDRPVYAGIPLTSLKNQFYLYQSFNPSLAITTFLFFFFYYVKSSFHFTLSDRGFSKLEGI